MLQLAKMSKCLSNQAKICDKFAHAMHGEDALIRLLMTGGDWWQNQA
ncbi:hypothetical protein LU290_04650 [Moraxella nasibovis]|nr:hypothetical protein [Moraxella nasibovis]WFF39513.1 hypothetical protein LU290_04650 [Moraxella nasibovis]